MLEQNGAPTAGAQTTTPPAAGQTTPPPEAIGPEAFLNDIVKARGAPPNLTDETDPALREVIEEQFRQQTRNLMTDIETSIREVSPDITRADVQKFTRAFIERDPLAMWQAAQAASRKEAEAEQNDEKSEDLRTEPASSGSRGTERKPASSLTEVMLNIADSYAN